MTHLLKKAFAKASKLPEVEQNVLARWMIEKLVSGKGMTKPLDLDDANGFIETPLQALASLPHRARQVRLATAGTFFPKGGHWQGIQSVSGWKGGRRFCFLSRDSRSEALFISTELPSDQGKAGKILWLQKLPSDGRQPPLRHVGGIQLIGNFLVLGLEDNQAKKRSQVQFWDISNPFQPVQRIPLTIFRKSSKPKRKTAGAVGIVKRMTDHLLVVANWGSQVLDFYTSNGRPLGDDNCRFSLKASWNSATANRNDWQPDRKWGKYQSVNLFSSSMGDVFMFGLNTNTLKKDFVDLFSIDINRTPRNIVHKLANKHMVFKRGVRFIYGSGMAVESPDKLVCYATERSARELVKIGVSS